MIPQSKINFSGSSSGFKFAQKLEQKYKQRPGSSVSKSPEVSQTPPKPTTVKIPHKLMKPNPHTEIKKPQIRQAFEEFKTGAPAALKSEKTEFEVVESEMQAFNTSAKKSIFDHKSIFSVPQFDQGFATAKFPNYINSGCSANK